MKRNQNLKVWKILSLSTVQNVKVCFKECSVHEARQALTARSQVGLDLPAVSVKARVLLIDLLGCELHYSSRTWCHLKVIWRFLGLYSPTGPRARSFKG